MTISSATESKVYQKNKSKLDFTTVRMIWREDFHSTENWTKLIMEILLSAIFSANIKMMTLRFKDAIYQPLKLFKQKNKWKISSTEKADISPISLGSKMRKKRRLLNKTKLNKRRRIIFISLTKYKTQERMQQGKSKLKNFIWSKRPKLKKR